MTTAIATPFLKAQRHLARRDPVLKKLVAAVGPCTLRHDADRFGALVRAIIAQQISTRAAAAIHGRLTEALAATGVTAAAVLALPARGLRAAGLSTAKARALADLADHVRRGALALDTLHLLPDEEIISRLLPVRGIGRWTAEMFLIFSLGRFDVLPVTDWGLRVGARQQYGLGRAPGKAQLTALAEPWRPYRTVATWYLWRSLGFVPQSGLNIEDRG